jgi:hypothetical protein
MRPSRKPTNFTRNPSSMRFIVGDSRSYAWYWLHHMVSPPWGTVTAERIEIFGGTGV